MNYPKIYTNATLWHKHGITGKNTVIAIVDSGVHKHPDLDLLSSSTDEHGHGTHVAGIAAGHKYGVAPDAKILPVKVADRNGHAPLANIANGLERLINWRKTHKERLVVNISMSMTHAPQILDRINELVSLDVPVCVAACNDGGEKSALADYSAPVVVGNLETPDELHETSTCWAHDTDCAGLGTDVYSCWKDGSYRKLTGTSMATPAVAGMFALILSRWPDMSEEDAYKYFMSLCKRSVACPSGHRIPVPAFIDDFKEEDEVRETKYITKVPEGKVLVVRADNVSGSDKVGTIRNGTKVTVLAVENGKSLVAEGLCGWVSNSYLDTEAPDEEEESDRREIETFDTPIQWFTSSDKKVRLSEHFAVEDFWSNPKYEKIQLDTRIAAIWELYYVHFGERPRLRNKYVGTDRYEPVASAGYRDPDIDWNGSKTSRHCNGTGIDFEIPGVPAYKLAQFAETIPEIGGIGHYYTTSEPVDKQEHIHIDTREREGSAKWGHQGKTSGCNIPTFGGVYAAIKREHEGAAVRLIQSKLKELGYSVGSIDGAFGSKTETALKQWQEANDLSADGIYGRNSNNKMKLFDW